MDIATNATISHIQKKNKIGIFGDYDVDGATSPLYWQNILNI